ncbi:MAG: sigma-70 family RNA polymerase sigma factor [Acidobacteria bacterium]|nr:sigma-70 family RNA polymerase sigma factor [Acidobacteriota bacterium]MDA1237310.1 sigma-70 family RNA polymerase sigma factor [Acidobacteriota bacterium]
MQELPASRELVDRALLDQEAFAELVEKHKAMVYSLVYNFFHNRSIAEDIAQDAYLDLYRNLDRIESDKHLAFWLRQTVTRKCIDWSRRQKHRRCQPLDEAPEPGVEPRERDLMLESALAAKVAALPEKMRLVVILRFQEDLKLTEIAETLDVPVNTVKTTLRRALDRLRPKVSHLAEEARYGPIRA